MNNLTETQTYNLSRGIGEALVALEFISKAKGSYPKLDKKILKFDKQLKKIKKEFNKIVNRDKNTKNISNETA